MKKMRTLIASVGAAGLLTTVGALLVPAGASAHAVTHTLKFTSVEGKSIMFSKRTGAQQDRDVNKAGKLIGFDELYFKASLNGRTATDDATLDIKGGFIYAVVVFNFVKGSGQGKVTGGTGVFKGVTGTISAKFLNSAGSRTAVTITYH